MFHHRLLIRFPDFERFGLSSFRLSVLCTRRPFTLQVQKNKMDGYDSWSEFSESDIQYGLSLLKKIKKTNCQNSPDGSCSECAGDSDSSDGCYTDDSCSCSECADSSDCDGAVCALAPKPKRRSRRTVKSGKKTQKKQQLVCREGVCPLVRKPKKARGKTKTATRKPAKKSPRTKASSCCCCYDCC